ncbi:TIM barrel protein, partial [candidate division KSB1 bacterium]|nr:TIM barrel protein [candidate division KSB1 bacterium]
MNEKMISTGLELLEAEFGKDKVKKCIAAVCKFKIEIPGWIFGEFGGGRFAGYMPPACARNIYEKLDDAAFVNKLTRATDSVAMHVLWDFSNDEVSGSYKIARQVNDAAQERGLKVGSISPTYFLKGSYRGSLSADEAETRQRYIEQTVLAGEIARDYGIGLVTLWLPDGSQYPGQANLQRAMRNLRTALDEIHRQMDKNVRLLIEYKLFEPGTYSTVLSDWGSAYM